MQLPDEEDGGRRQEYAHLRDAESTAAHATDLEPVVETRDAILAVTIRPGNTLVDEPGSVAQIGDDRARMVGRLRTVDLHVFGCDPDTASVPPYVPAASGASPSHLRSARSPQSGSLPPPWLAPRHASTRHRRPSPRRSRSRLRAEDVEYSEFERHRVRLRDPDVMFTPRDRGLRGERVTPSSGFPSTTSLCIGSSAGQAALSRKRRRRGRQGSFATPVSHGAVCVSGDFSHVMNIPRA